MLHTKNDVLGVLYIIQELRRIYESEFAISSKNAYQNFENYTEETYQKVSESTFARLFNFEKKPKLSYASMNKITQWVTKGDYHVFTKYVEAYLEKIERLKLIPNEELIVILLMIENENKIIIENNSLKAKKMLDIIVEPKENIETQIEDKTITGKNNTLDIDFADIKQENILSAHNSSRIKKIKGKISQLNFLGFGNKQEIDDSND